MTPSRQAEQRNSEQASPQSEQAQLASCRRSPSCNAEEKSKSQRISNQLHGTIAFLRSGMNNCPSEKGSNHAIPDFDFRPKCVTFQSGKPDLHPVVSPFEDATIGNKEQLHILDHHFAQHFLKLRGFCSGLERGHGSPSDVPLTREADPKLNPQGKWDDLPPVAKFQEAMIHKHEYISRVGLQGPECKERHYHFVPKYYPIGAKLGEELFRNQSPVHSYEEKAEPMHYGNRTMTMWPKKPDDPLIAKNLKTLGQPGRLSNDSLDKPLDLSENGRERKESGSLSSRPSSSGQSETESHFSSHPQASPQMKVLSPDKPQKTQNSCPPAALHRALSDSRSDVEKERDSCSPQNKTDAEPPQKSFDQKTTACDYSVSQIDSLYPKVELGFRIKLPLRRLKSETGDESGQG
nr:PREDICTED: uncharacterized protein LOC102355573 [Latimeria chalumnae]|eukprot:XP_014344205.1 PREDICTED: uncharacterized protein LOC102355573 [Latimeria chalumnae]